MVVKRDQLEHIIRAAAEIADDHEIVVIGSQAVLGQFPNAPDELLMSVEADVYPRNKPERADLIDGSIGEASPFHELYGYYAQGIGPETATLPSGWQNRLIKVHNANTSGRVGLCLEIHDLVMSKYVAGRPKDAEFIKVAIKHQMVQKKVLVDRLKHMNIDGAHKQELNQKMQRDFNV